MIAIAVGMCKLHAALWMQWTLAAQRITQFLTFPWHPFTPTSTYCVTQCIRPLCQLKFSSASPTQLGRNTARQCEAAIQNGKPRSNIFKWRHQVNQFACRTSIVQVPPLEGKESFHHFRPWKIPDRSMSDHGGLCLGQFPSFASRNANSMTLIRIASKWPMRL